MAEEMAKSIFQIFSGTCNLENENNTAVDYIIHVTYPDPENSESVMYGIECVLYHENGFTESAIVNDVTTSLRFAKEIVDALCTDSVTPVSLYDILFDMIE